MGSLELTCKVQDHPMQQFAAAPRPDGHMSKPLEDLHTYVGIVRRGWRLIIIGVLVAMTAAVIFLARSKTVYRASARLLVIQQGGRPIQVAGNNDPLQNLQGSNDSLTTHLMIIRSQVVAEQAVALSGLNTVSVPSVIGNLTAKLPNDSARVIEIGYKAKSRDEAARVMDGVIRSYNRFLNENYQKSTNEVISLIVRARDGLNLELRSLEKQYLEYRQKNPAYSTDERGHTFIARRLDQWDQAKNQLLARSLQLKSQLELGRKLAGDGADPSTIINAIGQLSGLGGITQTAPPVPDAAPAGELSFEGLRNDLADTEAQRKTAEQLLSHLQRELANSASTQEVSDREIAEVFDADPAVADARARLRETRAKLRTTERLSRSSRDPSVVHLRKRIEYLEEELQRLWEDQKSIIAKRLSRDSNLEVTATVRQAEADLVILKAKEATLRDRLHEFASEQLPWLRQEHEQLARLRGAGYPQVRLLEQQIAHLENSGAQPPRHRPGGRKVEALLDSIARGLESIEVIRADLQKKFDEDMNASKKAEIGQLEEVNLRNNLDRQRTLFYSMVDQLKQAQLGSDFGSVSAQTINPPAVAAERPNPASILALALAGGCGLGTLAAFVANMLDARVHTVAELRGLVDLPVIGLIPQLSSDQIQATGVAGLLSHEKPRSALAESYKSIRTNLESLRRSRQAQVLLVSSAHPGDGKSTTASNLAITLAQAGRRVLLVDADLRTPSLHSMYNLPRDRGLTDALERGVTIAELVQPTAVNHLDLLTAGPEVTTPAELLASHRLGKVLDEIRHGYDTIIIDSSPLLTVTDPSIIAAVADGILLVVCIASTWRHDIERTTELLETLGTPVLGIVINSVSCDQLCHNHIARKNRAYQAGQVTTVVTCGRAITAQRNGECAPMV